MTPYDRLIHQLRVLQRALQLDWRDFEADQLSSADLDQLRELARGTREMMGQLDALLDTRFGPKSGD